MMQVYVDVFRTNNGIKMVIFGDGYIKSYDKIAMVNISNQISNYNEMLVHKYGKELEIRYYIDIRGIGYGIYELVREELGHRLKINKLELA